MVYKSGTGTRGWGHQDACVGTWDLRMRDEGLEDIKNGTRGRVGWGSGDAESSLRKQAWRNPKEGRVGCLHQNIFKRKVTDIAFTSDFLQ